MRKFLLVDVQHFLSLGFVISKFGLRLAELALTSRQFESIRTGAPSVKADGIQKWVAETKPQ